MKVGQGVGIWGARWKEKLGSNKRKANEVYEFSPGGHKMGDYLSRASVW